MSLVSLVLVSVWKLFMVLFLVYYVDGEVGELGKFGGDFFCIGEFVVVCDCFYIFIVFGFVMVVDGEEFGLIVVYFVDCEGFVFGFFVFVGVIDVFVDF